MIRNRSVPLRIPPHWINKETVEELEEKLNLKKLVSESNIEKRIQPIDPKLFLDAGLMSSSFKGTTWAIEYLDFLVNSGEFSLVNSASGRIEEVLLTIFLDKSDQEYNNQQKEVYTTLIRDLGNYRVYKILCNKKQQETIQKWFNDLDLEHVSFDYFYSVFNITCWAQDPYVALHSTKLNRTILAASNDFNRFDDQTIACDVGAQSEKILDFPSYYYLQGGNILCSLDYVLIGKDYVEKNTGRAYLGNEQGVLDSFSGLFDGKKSISVGLKNAIPVKFRSPPQKGNKCVTTLTFSGTWQPVFHLDMFITLTGIRNKENQKEILVIGSLYKAQETLKELKLPFSQPFELLNKTYAEYFKEIGQLLQKYFHIVEIPIFPGKATFGYGGIEYETNYFLTYNNVVIESHLDENGAEQKHVCMPTYAKDKTSNPDFNQNENEIRIRLDKKSMKVWESIGFKVFPMPDMESFASSGGAVHCLTKILKRNSNSIPLKFNVMSDVKHFKVSVEGSALGLLHLMGTKGLIKLAADRSLGDYQGEVHISSDPKDKNVTLYVNPGEGSELEDKGPPRPTAEPPRPTDEGPPRPTDEGPPRPTDEGPPRPTDEGPPRPADEGPPRPTDEGPPRP